MTCLASVRAAIPTLPSSESSPEIARRNLAVTADRAAPCARTVSSFCRRRFAAAGGAKGNGGTQLGPKPHGSSRLGAKSKALNGNAPSFVPSTSHQTTSTANGGAAPDGHPSNNSYRNAAAGLLASAGSGDGTEQNGQQVRTAALHLTKRSGQNYGVVGDAAICHAVVWCGEAAVWVCTHTAKKYLARRGALCLSRGFEVFKRSVVVGFGGTNVQTPSKKQFAP